MEKKAKKSAKKKKLRRFLLNFGKLVIDGAKLCFGGLVLGAIIKGDFSPSTLLVSGIIASAVGAIAGLVIITLCEEG